MTHGTGHKTRHDTQDMRHDIHNINDTRDTEAGGEGGGSLLTVGDRRKGATVVLSIINIVKIIILN